MKLKELKLIIDEIVESYSDSPDLEVCIPNNDDSTKIYGGTPYTKINKVQLGFDWDHNKVFLLPEKDMIEKK